MSDRPCTCHPDDNPPVPCPQKFALSECRASLPPSGDTSAQLAEYLASGARLVEAFHQLPGVARAMREAACLLGKSETHPTAPAPDALDAARWRFLTSLERHNVYLMDSTSEKEKCVFVYAAKYLDSAVDQLMKDAMKEKP